MDKDRERVQGEERREKIKIRATDDRKELYIYIFLNPILFDQYSILQITENMPFSKN